MTERMPEGDVEQGVEPDAVRAATPPGAGHAPAAASETEQPSTPTDVAPGDANADPAGPM